MDIIKGFIQSFGIFIEHQKLPDTVIVAELDIFISKCESLMPAIDE